MYKKNGWENLKGERVEEEEKGKRRKSFPKFFRRELWEFLFNSLRWRVYEEFYEDILWEGL